MAKLKKSTTTVDGGFNKMVEEVEAERNAAPSVGAMRDEYEFIAGYRDKNGTLHKTFELRYMTGEDEEVLARYQNMSFAKLAPMLIGRIVTRIGTIEKSALKKKEWDEIIRNLYVADQDCVLMRIRETSLNEELKAVHKCPECGTKLTTVFEYDELNIIEWDGEEGIPFDLPRGYMDETGAVHKEGILNYPRGVDREAAVGVGAKNGARGNTIMLSHLMQFDDGYPVNEKVVQKLTTVDRNYLMNLLQTGQFGIDLTIPVECTNCGNEFEGRLDANFTL